MAVITPTTSSIDAAGFVSSGTAAPYENTAAVSASHGVVRMTSRLLDVDRASLLEAPYCLATRTTVSPPTAARKSRLRRARLERLHHR